MINPFKEVAPWARILTLLIIGTAVIYGIGRWDARISQRSRQLERETELVLSSIRDQRAWRDSLAHIADSLASVSRSLARRDRQLTTALRANRELAAREVAELETTPLDSLLRPLRLRPIALPDPNPRVVYATDSAGVRFLAGRMLRLAQVERETVTLGALAATRLDRVATLAASLAAITADRDTVAVQLGLAAPLLERWRRHNECRILWLVPCPSRTTSLVVGVIVGGVVTIALTRE